MNESSNNRPTLDEMREERRFDEITDIGSAAIARAMVYGELPEPPESEQEVAPPETGHNWTRASADPKQRRINESGISLALEKLNPQDDGKPAQPRKSKVLP